MFARLFKPELSQPPHLSTLIFLLPFAQAQESEKNDKNIIIASATSLVFFGICACLIAGRAAWMRRNNNNNNTELEDREEDHPYYLINT